MTYADATRQRAAELDHEWDRRAIEWPLTADSVVVEVGGYTGRWALQIAERYGPRLFVFEPQPWAWKVCGDVLWEKARVFRCALGDCNGYFPMAKWETDGCTFIGGDADEGYMREIGETVQELGLTHIDLMLMNIEGYEYTLIPHMLDQGIVPQRLMVQMHSFAGDSAALRATLAQHYGLLWDYGDVLSAWGRQ